MADFNFPDSRAPPCGNALRPLARRRCRRQHVCRGGARVAPAGNISALSLLVVPDRGSLPEGRFCAASRGVHRRVRGEIRRSSVAGGNAGRPSSQRCGPPVAIQSPSIARTRPLSLLALRARARKNRSGERLGEIRGTIAPRAQRPGVQPEARTPRMSRDRAGPSALSPGRSRPPGNNRAGHEIHGGCASPGKPQAARPDARRSRSPPRWRHRGVSPGRRGFAHGLIINARHCSSTMTADAADLAQRRSTTLARPGCFVWVALRDASRLRAGLILAVQPPSSRWSTRATAPRRRSGIGNEIFTVLHVVRSRRRAPRRRVSCFTGRTTCSRSAPSPSRLPRRARALRREPAVAAPRRATCSTRSWTEVLDRYFPARAIEPSWSRSGAHLSPYRSARQIEALNLRQAEGRHAQAATRAAKWLGGQLYGGRVRPCARRGWAILPRCLRPPGAPNQALDSLRDTVTTRSGHLGWSPSRERNHQGPRAYASLAVPTMIAASTLISNRPDCKDLGLSFSSPDGDDRHRAVPFSLPQGRLAKPYFRTNGLPGHAYPPSCAFSTSFNSTGAKHPCARFL